jgi:hypothetical protein
VEARTQRTLDYGEALEASVGPHSKAPDPWAAPPQPAKVSAPRARPGHHADAGQAAQEAQAQGLADPQRGRIGMQEHRSAPAVREATGQAGQNVDSTHLVPQVVYNWIRKSPALARTANLPAAINIAIDSVWVPKWARATGRGKQVTGGDVREWVSEGIRNVPDSLLSPAAKGTLQWSLELELQGLGITKDTVIVPRWR